MWFNFNFENKITPYFEGKIAEDYQLKKTPPCVYTIKFVGRKIEISKYMARPRRRQRGVFANANINQQDLIAWLDAQEPKPLMRVAPLEETVEAFDPLYNEPEVAPAQRPLPQRIVDLYEVEELGGQVRGAGIRRTKKWRFDKILTHSLVSRMLHKKRFSVRRGHKLNLRVEKHRNQ